MRPTHENAATLEAEAAAAALMCDPYKIELHKLPRRYELDYMMMHDHTLYGWLEVKCRPGVDRYATYSISLAKIDRGCSMAERFGGRFLVLVQRTSGLAVIDCLDQKPVAVAMGGRTDRGDPEDREPLCHYSWDQFTMLKQPT